MYYVYTSRSVTRVRGYASAVRIAHLLAAHDGDTASVQGARGVECRVGPIEGQSGQEGVEDGCTRPAYGGHAADNGTGAVVSGLLCLSEHFFMGVMLWCTSSFATDHYELLAPTKPMRLS